jgi:transposase
MKLILFKDYDQKQPMLLPPSLEELVPPGHLARLVNRIIDDMPPEIFLEGYEGGGTTSYHPQMLMKVIVYGYLLRVYSGRQLAKLLRENVVMMWLSAQSYPDFRTLNRFRSERCQYAVRQVFKAVLSHCQQLGLVQYESYFIDGTKLEANANRHRVVWRKRVERMQAQVEAKIDALLDEVDKLVAEEELQADEIERLEAEQKERMQSEKAQAAYQRLLQRLRQLKPAEQRPAKRLLRQLRERIAQQAKYSEQQLVLAGRNSYSKTDPDAIAMRMKDQTLKPGYNVLLGTENQVILHYDLQAKNSDSNCFIEHMEGFKKLHGRHCRRVIGDAAFGSHENYRYVRKQGLQNYLKYNYYFQDTKKQRTPQLSYEPAQDAYRCPANKLLKFHGEIKKRQMPSGFLQKAKLYSSRACYYCKAKCTTAKQRVVQRNESLERFKAEARRNLLSSTGIWLRRRRGVEVESVFGQLKRNFSFKRFHLRGKEKNGIDFGFLAIAHNLSKLHLVNT